MARRRLLLCACAAAAALPLTGCEPPLCTQLDAMLGAPGCGEAATLNSPPEVGPIRSNDIAPAVGQTVTFFASARDPDGDALYYEWDLDGDGEYDHRGYEDDASEVRKVYRRGAVITVKLRVSDFPDLPGGEGQTVRTRRIRVHTPEEFDRDRAPVAAFTVDPNPVRAGEPANLDASATRDPDGDRLYYVWSRGGDPAFGDEGFDPTVQRTFEAVGDHGLQLRVYDEYGKSDGLTKPLTVAPGPSSPRPELSIDPSPANVGQEVTFSAAASTDPDNDIDRYEWSLDGEPGRELSTTEPVVRRTYSAPGDYSIGMEVVDRSGRRAGISATLRVNGEAAPNGNAPTAVLDIDPNPARVDENVSFSAMRSTDPNGDIASYDWDLDGAEGYEVHTVFPTTSRTYGGVGSFPVRLRVNDAAGNSEFDTQTMQVVSSPRLAVRSAGTRKPRLGRRRSFSARLSGKSSGSGGDTAVVGGLGTLRASLSGPPKLSRPERVLKRFLAAKWRTRLALAVDRDAGRATVTGRILATPRRGRGRACARLSIDIRAGALPTGKFTIAGGTGAAARLYGEGAFRFRAAGKAPATILGILRAGQGKPRPCSRGFLSSTR
jgi:hypothetical protein